MIVGDYDSISGYTVRQIEDALGGISSWEGWRDEIYFKYIYNPSREHLELLFDAYE